MTQDPFTTKKLRDYDRIFKGTVMWQEHRSFLTQTIEETREEERNRFKREVVAYSLDELEHDCLSGPGLNEQTEQAIERLRYWILEKEVSLTPSKEEP
jgi:hypothetical protein